MLESSPQSSSIKVSVFVYGMMQVLSRFALFAMPVDRLLQGVGTRFAQSFHEFVERTATTSGTQAWAFLQKRP
jgi:hypothetical protein